MGLALGLLLWKGLEIGLLEGLRFRNGVVVKVGFCGGVIDEVVRKVGLRPWG